MKPERIADVSDPRLADYRDVRDPERLRAQGAFLAEGRTVVRELLAEPRYRVRSLLVTAPALAALDDALASLPDATPVFRVERAELERLAGVRFHQGCVAAVDVPEPRDPASLAGPGQRCVVALEAVSDPDNVGSVFRNAAAFGAGAVFLDSRCASPLYRKAVRTSLGASLRLPFAGLELPQGVAWLRERGFRVWGLTPAHDAVPLADVDPAGRVALLLGAEGQGLSEPVLRAADLRVRIPMVAGVDSVNVATAGAIALQHLYASASR